MFIYSNMRPARARYARIYRRYLGNSISCRNSIFTVLCGNIIYCVVQEAWQPADGRSVAYKMTSQLRSARIRCGRVKTRAVGRGRSEVHAEVLASGGRCGWAIVHPRTGACSISSAYRVNVMAKEQVPSCSVASKHRIVGDAS
jgi:hypothetical protein